MLGVTGGIAAYKAADLTSKLIQAGAEVDVILTESGSKFVGAATFQALTKRPVHSGVFEEWSEECFGHISLGHDADAIVIAPATANTIAKLAAGLADDMLGAVVLSSTKPVLIAPAMEHEMFHHPATQANLDTLRARGVVFIGPESGRLASGEIGEGRLSAPETIIGAIRQTIGRGGMLAGRKIVITAGGTREPMDPVRYLGNRSSGLMGYALAQAAIDEGATVTLVSSVSAIKPPYGANLVQVQTAEEMLTGVHSAVADADILVMAAAVADFRPAQVKTSKIKKTPGTDTMTLELVRNPDILASLGGKQLIKIGFAAETDDLIANASKKLHEKGLALIVANDAEATIGAPDSTAHLVFADGTIQSLPRLPKEAVAVHVVAAIARVAHLNG